jgi:hypothetical protein
MQMKKKNSPKCELISRVIFPFEYIVNYSINVIREVALVPTL